MDKTFTSNSYEAEVSQVIAKPRKATLSFIKQFAQVYTYVGVGTASIGNLFAAEDKDLSGFV